MNPLEFGRVEEFLRRRFGADHVEVLDAGTWSQAFAMKAGGRDLVVRFDDDLTEYEKDRLAGTWSYPGLPVPEVLDIGEAFDGHFVVSQRVYGIPLDGLDDEGWRRTLPSLLEALAALREVRLPGGGFGLFDSRGNAPHGSWAAWLLAVIEGYGETRIRGWRTAMAAVPGALDRYEACVERFEEAMAVCPEVRLIAHTDLGAGNTLVADGHVSGIIDWGNAVAGDPLYDIAHLTFWAPWHHGCPEMLLRHSAADVLGDADFDERVYAYELHVALAAQRFNAAMGRLHLLEEIADRAESLPTPESERGI